MLGLQAASGPKKAMHALTEALSQAELAIQFLLEVGKSWEFGLRLAGILQDMRDSRLTPLLLPRKTQSYPNLPAVPLPAMAASSSFGSSGSSWSGESWPTQSLPAQYFPSSQPFTALFDPYAGDPFNAPFDNVGDGDLMFDIDLDTTQGYAYDGLNL